MVSKSDFVIENGTLIRYTGPGGDVVVPEGVIKIEGYPDDAMWWRGAFEGCKMLTSIVLPEGLQSIGDDAFMGCERLKSIALPASLKHIRGRAFQGCYSLTSITLPESLQSIEWGAFMGCEWLTSIVLPEGIQSLAGATFYGCEKLSSITFPKGLQSIENDAFFRCKKLTCIRIPEGVKNIEKEAFSRCERLSRIMLPKSLQNIGDDVFCKCENLTIYASAGSYAAKYARENGIPLITELGNFQTVAPRDFVIEDGALIEYNGPGGDVVVPMGVTSIEGYDEEDWVGAFESCESLTGITLPEGLQSIGEDAFFECEGLASITLPKSLKNIGDGAFYGCKGLTSITLPERLQSIERYAFSGCEGLTSITLPEGLQSIGEDAFSECKNLTIYASAGSFAAKYAKENGIPLILISKPRKFQVVTLKEPRAAISKGIAMPNLLICPDCGGKVSRRAPACPHCGCPISIILEDQSN